MSLVELGKQLLEAAKNGLTEEVRALMFNGAPFTTDWLGTSSLHYAAQNGQLEMVDVLLKAGLSRDARTKVDRTPLHYACQEGHSDIVQLLVYHGADVEAKDMLKMTPLHWAVEKGHFEVVQILLTNGATPTELNKFDKTPLDIAITNRRADIVELLQLATNGQTLEVNSDAVIEEVTTSENLDVAGHFNTQNIVDVIQVTVEDKSPESLSWLESSAAVTSSPDSSVLSDANQMFILTEAGKLALKTLQDCKSVSDVG